MRLADAALGRLARTEVARVIGRVTSVRGLTLLAEGLPAPVGALVRVRGVGSSSVLAEAVGFDGGQTVLMSLGDQQGIRPGDCAELLETEPTVRVSGSMLGRVINGLGEPIDGKGPISGGVPLPLKPTPISAMRRGRIVEPLTTGVRAIDSMVPLGRGQRMGIFAGPGVGKSTLLAMIARNAGEQGTADVNVIALIGERGREVRDFLEEALGEEGLARSVVVVATSDESALMRLRAASAACAVAEHFRGGGADVMLMIDSVTRFAHAQRQVGLAVGEPPATRGYTPSVFASLPVLLERAGAVEDERGVRVGSITGLYTVLVEGDDTTEPVADAVRGILDGHLMLSRKIAQRGHFPAIDVLDSVSRVMTTICDDQHVSARRSVAGMLAAYDEAEELIQIGAYTAGGDPRVDAAVTLRPDALGFLAQGTHERTSFAESKLKLVTLAQRYGQLRERGGVPAGQPPRGGAQRPVRGGGSA